MVRIFILLLTVFLMGPTSGAAESGKASSTSSGKNNEIFVAAGEALGFPGSIRYRYSFVEGGYFGNYLLGAGMFFNNSPFSGAYAEMGAGIILTDPESIGFIGAIGYRTPTFLTLGFRFELNAIGGLNSHVKGGALVGIISTF